MTGHTMLESPLAWSPQYKSLNSRHFLTNLHEVLRGSFPAIRELLSSSSQPLHCKGDYTLGIGLRSLNFLIWFALTYLTWSHSRARLLTELAVPLDPVQSLRRKVTVSSVAHQRMLMKWKQMADSFAAPYLCPHIRNRLSHLPIQSSPFLQP